MEELKTVENESYVPVLVITAQPSHKLKALEAGAKDFISKPFDMVEVKTRIRNMLEVRLLYKKLLTSNKVLGEKVLERTADLLKINKILQMEIVERRHSAEGLEESHKQLRELALHLQSIREDERHSISREIHDELGQMLTALKMDLYYIKNCLPESERALYEKVDADMLVVDEIIQAIKRICDELRPSILDHFGIQAAIESHAEKFQRSTGIICKVISELNNCVVDKARSTALFRIFQESLTNVARHSKATTVATKIHSVDGNITLEISDNGKGIIPEQQSKPKSFGLIGMRERAYQLGGVLTITSVQDKGTTITAVITAA
jgi:signal transduction histidine kinase